MGRQVEPSTEAAKLWIESGLYPPALPLCLPDKCPYRQHHFWVIRLETLNNPDRRSHRLIVRQKNLICDMGFEDIHFTLKKLIA